MAFLSQLPVLKIKFLDSKNYPGWHKTLPFKTEAPCEAFGEKVHEDDAYISIAQSKSGNIFGNILRIPKVSIVETIVLGIILFVIIFTIEKFYAIKGTLLAMFP